MLHWTSLHVILRAIRRLSRFARYANTRGTRLILGVEFHHSMVRSFTIKTEEQTKHSSQWKSPVITALGFLMEVVSLSTDGTALIYPKNKNVVWFGSWDYGKHALYFSSSPLDFFYILFYFLVFFFLFCCFRAAPVAFGSSQARGRIKAAATSLGHSHSNTWFELDLWPTLQLMATLDP